MPGPYWPAVVDSVVIYESALKGWVREEEIWHVLSYPSHQILKIGFGKPDAERDRRYRSKSTRAEGLTADGQLLELVLRRDGRAAEERCFVFHARYLSLPRHAQQPCRPTELCASVQGPPRFRGDRRQQWHLERIPANQDTHPPNR